MCCAGATCRKRTWPDVETWPVARTCYRSRLPSCLRISFWPCPLPTASISNEACRIGYLGRRAWRAPTDSTSDISSPQSHRQDQGEPREYPPVSRCCGATWTCTWSSNTCLSRCPVHLHRSGSLSDHLQASSSIIRAVLDVSLLFPPSFTRSWSVVLETTKDGKGSSLESCRKLSTWKVMAFWISQSLCRLSRIELQRFVLYANRFSKNRCSDLLDLIPFFKSYSFERESLKNKKLREYSQRASTSIPTRKYTVSAN